MYLTIFVLTAHNDVATIGLAELLIAAGLVIFVDAATFWRFRQIFHDKRFDTRVGSVDRYTKPLFYGFLMLISFVGLASIALANVIIGFLLITKIWTM